MNYSKPQLFIIAGANGAGKSSTSKLLLEPYSITAFDWDKEFYSQWSKFGFDPVIMQGIRDSTSSLFRERIDQALKSESDFAFETNLHDSSLFSITKEFQESGFEINLYFLLVSKMEICKERVKYRVEQEKGHFVSESTIENRFLAGLKNLNQSFRFFNHLTILDTSLDHDAELIAAFENGKVQIAERVLPEQVQEYLPHIVAKLADHSLR